MDDLPLMTLAVVRIIKEVGVPYLDQLIVSVCEVDGVSLDPSTTLPSVEWLRFDIHGLNNTCVHKLLESLCKERHHRLPPKLASIWFYKGAFKEREDEEQFFGSL